MSERNGLSRGDRNRNERLARLRDLVPAGNAIVGIDLADVKQAIVVTDHDSRVLARRRLLRRAWQLGEVLDWALAKAKAAGFSSVTVACTPTGGGVGESPFDFADSPSAPGGQPADTSPESADSPASHPTTHPTRRNRRESPTTPPTRRHRPAATTPLTPGGPPTRLTDRPTQSAAARPPLSGRAAAMCVHLGGPGSHSRGQAL